MDTTRQLLKVLEQLREANPTMRFRQLAVNISHAARGWTKSAPWDVEDEEFLKAAILYLENSRDVGWSSPAALVVEEKEALA